MEKDFKNQQIPYNIQFVTSGLNSKERLNRSKSSSVSNDDDSVSSSLERVLERNKQSVYKILADSITDQNRAKPRSVKKKVTIPIVGFSNLIKRDFFNRDGPKREPMILRQICNEKDSG